MNRSSGHHGVRFSLRGLLAMIAFFAVACAALKFANAAWWIGLSGTSLVLFMAMVVVALVGEGRMRAFAIGFVVCGLFYGGLLYVSGDDEMDPYEGGLPTTQVMLPVFQAVVVNTFFDDKGQPMPNYVPPQNFATLGGGGGGGLFAGPSYHHRETPQREVFVSIAHLLWAVIFGLLGGGFARFVYARNERHSRRGEQSVQHP